MLQEPLEKKNSSVPFLISLPFASLQSADGERDIKRYDQVEAACICVCACVSVCVYVLYVLCMHLGYAHGC